MVDDESILPALADLHHRHRGLTPPVASSYAEAAEVCLSRHHDPPKRIHVSAPDVADQSYLATWTAPTNQQLAAWGNRDDATRDGAYSIALAAAEAHLGLFALGRAEQRSGSDYLVSTRSFDQGNDEDQLNFEDVEVLRFEVSGIDRPHGEAPITYRLTQKLDQLRRGASPLPSLAAVVGFSLLRVVFARS